MSEPEVPDAGEEADEGQPLTPKEREKLLKNLANVQGAFSPRFQAGILSDQLKKGLLGAQIKSPLANIAGTNAFANIAGTNAFANIAGTNAFANIVGDIAHMARFTLLDSLEPLLAQQRAWQTQFKFINSDILRFTGAQQAQLNLLGANLIKTSDFGFDKHIARFANIWAVQQTNWLASIEKSFGNLKTAFYPSNLQGVEGADLSDIEAVVLLDGIALYEVPRQEIAESLLRAESSCARREILGRKWRQIAADCRESLEVCETQVTAHHVKVALDAIAALERGQSHSAQALSGSLLDTLIRKYLPKTKPLIVPGKKVKMPDAYMEFSVRKYIALAPIWQAFQQYHQENGDPIPRNFNRHATAHTVSPQQYSRRNAVQGLMLVCGLLRFIEEQAAAQQAA